MPELIYARRALELLCDVVDGNEDFVYHEDPRVGRCMYVLDGQPSCLVGHVLARAGWTVEQVAGLDPYLDDYIYKGGVSASELFDAFPEYFTKDAGRVLAAAQGAQDLQNSWGDALEFARQRFEKIQAQKDEENTGE
jgi:hypothetical protein